MCLGKEHAGEVWCEITGSIPDEVTLDKEGNGEFSVDARNLAVWVKKAWDDGTIHRKEKVKPILINQDCKGYRTRVYWW